MANRAVSLVRNCKTENGWKRFPVVIAQNGRVRPNAVWVGTGKDRVERMYPEGLYQVRSYVGKAPQYVTVGKNAAKAFNAMLKAQRVSEVKADAVRAGVKLVPEVTRIDLKAEFDTFHDSTVDRGALVAAKKYRQAAEEFLASSGIVYADELTKEHITHWIGALRRRGLADRSIFNHYASIRAFLRTLKLEDRLPRAPRFEKKLPEVYSEHELEKFFAAILNDQYQTVTYSVALMCGLREQEMMHLEWADINWQEKTLRVRSKPQWKFKVKDAEERDVPIPTSLLSLLKKWQKERPAHKLITGTKTDQPNRKLLRTLKRTIYGAGLNCGTCDGCKSKLHECSHWWLHKFRATYITSLLRAGIDLRTVMALSGHSDLESVMRYLRPAEGHSLRAKVNAVFG